MDATSKPPVSHRMHKFHGGFHGGGHFSRGWGRNIWDTGGSGHFYKHKFHGGRGGGNMAKFQVTDKLMGSIIAWLNKLCG